MYKQLKNIKNKNNQCVKYCQLYILPLHQTQGLLWCIQVYVHHQPMTQTSTCSPPHSAA